MPCSRCACYTGRNVTVRRTCNVCGEQLPLTEFRVAGNSQYLRRQCKRCESRRSEARRYRRLGLVIPDRVLDPKLSEAMMRRIEDEARRVHERRCLAIKRFNTSIRREGEPKP